MFRHIKPISYLLGLSLFYNPIVHVHLWQLKSPMPHGILIEPGSTDKHTTCCVCMHGKGGGGGGCTRDTHYTNIEPIIGISRFFRGFIQDNFSWDYLFYYTIRVGIIWTSHFNLLQYIVWLRVTAEGSILELRIWSILFIHPIWKWCIQFVKSPFVLKGNCCLSRPIFSQFSPDRGCSPQMTILGKIFHPRGITTPAPP